MNGADLHAVIQTQTDIGHFIAIVIAIVTASLALSQKAFGLPPKGDHRSATLFINTVLTRVKNPLTD